MGRKCRIFWTVPTDTKNAVSAVGQVGRIRQVGADMNATYLDEGEMYAMSTSPCWMRAPSECTYCRLRHAVVISGLEMEAIEFGRLARTEMNVSTTSANVRKCYTTCWKYAKPSYKHQKKCRWDSGRGYLYPPALCLFTVARAISLSYPMFMALRGV